MSQLSVTASWKQPRSPYGSKFFKLASYLIVFREQTSLLTLLITAYFLSGSFLSWRKSSLKLDSPFFHMSIDLWHLFMFLHLLSLKALRAPLTLYYISSLLREPEFNLLVAKWGSCVFEQTLRCPFWKHTQSHKYKASFLRFSPNGISP